MKNRRNVSWPAWLCLCLLAVLLNVGWAADRAPDITTTNKQKRSEIMKAYDQALKGEAEAQKYIGTAYVTGDGVTRNTARARTWLERAARQGNTAAQYNLYVLLGKEPDANPADTAEASKWLRAAAEGDSMLAQFRLAEIYRRGEWGTPRNMKKSAVLYEAAAAQGYAAAQYNIGRFYEDGIGVAQDASTALAWYMKSALQGQVPAQLKVGSFFKSGRGVEQDDAAAFHWFERAAKANSALAQYNLSVFYARGDGVARDLVRSYAWSQLAAKQGYAIAIRKGDAYRRVLSTEQQARADALTRQWSAQSSPGSSRGHRENSYFDRGSSEPISGLEAVRSTAETTNRGQ